MATINLCGSFAIRGLKPFSILGIWPIAFVMSVGTWLSQMIIYGLFERPEIALINESFGAERDLHAKLWADTRSSISNTELKKMANNDVQENY